MDRATWPIWGHLWSMRKQIEALFSVHLHFIYEISNGLQFQLWNPFRHASERAQTSMCYLLSLVKFRLSEQSPSLRKWYFASFGITTNRPLPTFCSVIILRLSNSSVTRNICKKSLSWTSLTWPLMGRSLPMALQQFSLPMNFQGQLWRWHSHKCNDSYTYWNHPFLAAANTSGQFDGSSESSAFKWIIELIDNRTHNDSYFYTFSYGECSQSVVQLNEFQYFGGPNVKQLQCVINKINALSI